MSGPFLALPQHNYNYVRAFCLGKRLPSLHLVTKNHVQIQRSRRGSTGRNAHSKSFHQKLKMSWLQRQHTRDDADVSSDRWQKEQKYSSTAAHPTGLTVRYISIFLERCHRTLKQRFIPATLLLTNIKPAYSEQSTSWITRNKHETEMSRAEKSRGRGKMKRL